MIRLAACFCAGLALPACGPPPEARAGFDPAPPGQPPVLAPTADFDAVVAGAEPDAARIEAENAELAARAEALRARAGDLAAAPVIPPPERTRLEAAGG